MKKARALAALALLVAGCGYTEIHEVVLRAPGAQTAQTAHPVEVYMYGQAPPRQFFEVALLQVVGHGSHANPADLVRGLTARATQLGCDAVIRVQIDQGYSLAHAFAVCARWTAAPPVAPLPMPELIPTPTPAPALAPPPEPPAARAPAPPPASPGGTSL